jgi:hypothetical protein
MAVVEAQGSGLVFGTTGELQKFSKPLHAFRRKRSPLFANQANCV